MTGGSDLRDELRVRVLKQIADIRFFQFLWWFTAVLYVVLMPLVIRSGAPGWLWFIWIPMIALILNGTWVTGQRLEMARRTLEKLDLLDVPDR